MTIPFTASFLFKFFSAPAEISPAFRRFSRRTGTASSSTTTCPELSMGPISDSFSLPSSSYCLSYSDSFSKYSLSSRTSFWNYSMSPLLPENYSMLANLHLPPRLIDALAYLSLTQALTPKTVNHSGRHKQRLPKKEKPVSWLECNQFENLLIEFGPAHASFFALLVVFLPDGEVKHGPDADQERCKTADEQEVVYICSFRFCIFIDFNS